MNPVGPQTSAAPRFEPPVARPVEVRPPAAKVQPVQLNAAPPPGPAAQQERAPEPAPRNVAHQVAEEVQAIRESVQQAVDRLNEQMRLNQRALGFQVDEANDSLVVRVTNKQTGELVREISLEAAVRLNDPFETLKGMLFDETL